MAFQRFISTKSYILWWIWNVTKLIHNDQWQFGLWDATNGFIYFLNDVTAWITIKEDIIMFLTEIERSQQTLSVPGRFDSSKVKTELHLLGRQSAQFVIHWVRLNHYFHDNRLSRLLANKLSSNEQLADIVTIESDTGNYNQNQN